MPKDTEIDAASDEQVESAARRIKVSLLETN